MSTNSATTPRREALIAEIARLVVAHRDRAAAAHCTSWKSAAATPIRSSVTASRGCCRRRSNWCTARAARSACCRWDGSTIASRSPSGRGSIFTSFGDAMRVPGSKKSLLQAKADGADVRMVYSPMDALALARENPDREIVFFAHRLRDDDAVDRIDGIAGRTRRHPEFLGLLQPHHDRADDQGGARQPGPASRRVSRPRPRRDGDRHGAL